MTGLIMVIISAVIAAVAAVSATWIVVRARGARREREATDLYRQYFAGVEAFTQAYLLQEPSDEEWLAGIKSQAHEPTRISSQPADAILCVPPAPPYARHLRLAGSRPLLKGLFDRCAAGLALILPATRDLAGPGSSRARRPATRLGTERRRAQAQVAALLACRRDSKLGISFAAALLASALVAGITAVAHLGGVKARATPRAITAAHVTDKLTGIGQISVTGTYTVNVTITQTVGYIPCFLVCNKMELHGVGSDDAILDLSTLSSSNVEVDSGKSSVTLWIPLPTIGSAFLDPVKSYIASSHGVVSSFTLAFRNNPNGYKPLYAAAEKKIHDQAEHDPKLIAEAEQSTYELIARLLGTVGVQEVTIHFVLPNLTDCSIGSRAPGPVGLGCYQR